MIFTSMESAEKFFSDIVEEEPYAVKQCDLCKGYSVGNWFPMGLITEGAYVEDDEEIYSTLCMDCRDELEEE